MFRGKVATCKGNWDTKKSDTIIYLFSRISDDLVISFAFYKLSSPNENQYESYFSVENRSTLVSILTVVLCTL